MSDRNSIRNPIRNPIRNRNRTRNPSTFRPSFSNVLRGNLKEFDTSKSELQPEDNNESFRIEEHKGQKYIIIKNALVEELRNLSDFKVFDTIYDKEPKILVTELYAKIPSLINYKNLYGYKCDVIEELITYLTENNKEISKKINLMIKDENISYEYLWYLFNKDQKYYTFDNVSGCKIGSIVESYAYINTPLCSFFEVYGNIISSDGKNFILIPHKSTIREFKGFQKISTLPIHIMDDETYKTLYERGKIYRDLAIGAHHKEYTGNIIHRSFYTTKYKVSGRIMIDPSSFKKFRPNDYWEDCHDQAESNINALGDDYLYRTSPTLHGFAFSCKRWGELIIDNIREVKFDDDAFNELVLDENKKTLIKSLVQNKDHGFKDIIHEKGGGCIFLLHGEPGTGKSLTAEAIAELLHQPLYSISVGQLGTDIETLEHNLNEILETGSIWNAIILIDEADIFMESRQENNIKRNAMVAIFLRLLEYHDGILFLTTNRVKYFDKAFKSRISIALKYKDLDEETRYHVWFNLLNASNIDVEKINIKELSKVVLNGRQIRTVIRLAQILAHSENKEISKIHLNNVISQITQFDSDLNELNNL